MHYRCKIDWKKGKNVTVKTIKKKQKHKGNNTILVLAFANISHYNDTILAGFYCILLTYVYHVVSKIFGRERTVSCDY